MVVDVESVKFPYFALHNCDLYLRIFLLSLPQKHTQPKSVTLQMAIQRLMLDFRLHEAPRRGETGENEPRRGNPQLPVAFDFFLFDSRVDIVSPNQPRFGEGAIVERIFIVTQVTTTVPP